MRRGSVPACRATSLSSRASAAGFMLRDDAEHALHAPAVAVGLERESEHAHPCRLVESHQRRRDALHRDLTGRGLHPRDRRGHVVVARSGRLRPPLGRLLELLGDVVERCRHEVDAEKPLLLGSAKRNLDDGDVRDVRRGEQSAGSAAGADRCRIGVRHRDEGGGLGFGQPGGDQELADLKRVE